MHKFSGIFVVLLIYYFYPTSAIDPTCRGKRVNERCSSDEDCEGFNIQCVQGKCVCPFNFDSVQLTDKYTLCRPAPKAIGAVCTVSCFAPLLCQSGKCVCFGPGSSTSGAQCVIKCPAGQTLVGQDCRTVGTALNARCTADTDCQPANTYCSPRGVCDCIQGATKSGSTCILNCPDGKPPTKTCSKIMVNDASALANGEKQDSCPKGYGCATYGKPSIGHCCQLYCPYGSPDLSKSCEAGGSNKCPETHYCQTFEDKDVKNALCCPSPCREPTPLFSNGKCIKKSHWNDACKEDGNCEGGSTMQCKNGVCVCRQGFGQVNNTFATCQKLCNFVTQANVDGSCNTKVGVDNPCISSAQCPSRSICREGICACDCSSALSKNSCIDPDDPGGTNKLTEAISSLLGTSGGGTGK